MIMRPDVLVIGAGPTGLTLALQAQRHGAAVRIVDSRPAAFRPSRALVMHARTLEVLRPFGVVPELLELADTAPRARLHVGAQVVPAGLTGFGWRDTPFPHLTMVRQMDVETVLAQSLASRGIEVERGTELVDLRDSSHNGADVRATLRSPRGTEPEWCRFLVGCDGAGSTVRALTAIPWLGRPYRQEVVLADVELAGDLAPGVAEVAAGRRGLVFLFALGERATWRLLATRPAQAEPTTAGQSNPNGGREELQRLLDDARLGAQVLAVGWSSHIRVQHRLAASYRRGHVLLAGDAAHTHSPAAAQGMNTGIQDAANLGWKLAFAPSSSDPEGLLDSYEAERRRVARRVIALTDLVFWAEASTDPVASFLRGALAPLAAPLLPMVLRWPTLIGHVARVLSQLDVRYRTSPMSVEDPSAGGGAPRAGDRMPDAMVTCRGTRVPLHSLLTGAGVHVLLQRDAREPVLCTDGGRVHVHRLTDRPGSGVLAVRPDGYVGYRSAALDEAGLAAWLTHIGATA